MSVRRGTPVWVAVRPEKITISKSAAAGNGVNTIRGQVREVGYLGNLSIYRIALPSGKILQVSSQNERRSSREERGVDWDDEVTLTWEPSSPVVLTE